MRAFEYKSEGKWNFLIIFKNIKKEERAHYYAKFPIYIVVVNIIQCKQCRCQSSL